MRQLHITTLGRNEPRKLFDSSREAAGPSWFSIGSSGDGCIATDEIVRLDDGAIMPNQPPTAADWLTDPEQ